MENAVKYRLKQFLEKNDIKESDFCRSINVSSGYISGMRKSIQPEKLESIATNYPKLNIAWLLTGYGNMMTSPPEEISKEDKLQHTIESQQRTIESLSRTIENLTQKPK